MVSENEKKNPIHQQFDTTQEYSIDSIETHQESQPKSDKSEEEIRLLKEALIESKKCYQAMLETNLYGIIEMDINSIIIFMNPVMGKILGYDLEDVKGKKISEFLESDAEREKFKKLLTSLASGNRHFFPYLGKFKRKDGTSLELKIDWNFRRDRLGRIIGFISVISDVVAQKPSTTSPPSLTNEFQLLESIQNIVLICDLDGNIKYVNPAGADLLGFFTDELLEMNIVDVFPPYHLESIKKILLEPPSGQVHKSSLFTIDLMNRELKPITIEISASLIRKTGLPPEIFIIGHDVTQRRRIEKELFKNAKFEAVALFANGIVQDFHDYLTSVIGNIDFAQMILDPEGNVYKKLSEAKEGCAKMKDLTRQFVIFSGGGTPMKQPGSIVDIIRKIADDAVKGTDIRYELQVSENLWDISFDAKQMELAIHHLIVNAIEASPPGGIIGITIDNFAIGTTQDELTAFMKEGKYIRIAIQNAGPGIPQDILDRIFDPYFTTKRIRSKRGQGLGLTLAYSIVKRHHGYITVDTKPNVKTTFTVLLPASRREMREKTRVRQSQPYKGRILIIDDDETDSFLASDIIRRMGYQTELISKGEDAITVFSKAKETDKTFDAVILNVKTASHMSATEILKNILHIDPGIKGIVSSSYPNDPEMMDYQKYGFIAKLDKPYNIDEIRSCIETIFKKTNQR